MGQIATLNRQITLFYNSKSVRARKTLAYARVKGLAILRVDILKNKFTGTQIVELAHKLHCRVEDLVNQEHPAYKLRFKQHNFSTNDWIKMIQNNPIIMKQPIALRGNRTILVETPTDILKI